jgi:hypothetical protein
MSDVNVTPHVHRLAVACEGSAATHAAFAEAVDRLGLSERRLRG